MLAVVLTFDEFPLRLLGSYGNSRFEQPVLNRIAADSVVFDQHFGDDFSPAAEGLAWWSGCAHFPRTGTDLVSRMPSLPKLLAEGNIEARWLVDKDNAPWAPLPLDAAVETFGSFESLIEQACRVLEEPSSSDVSRLLWLKVGRSVWEESPLGEWDSEESDDALDRIDEALEPLWMAVRKQAQQQAVLFLLSAARGVSLGEREQPAELPATWSEEHVHLPLVVFHSNHPGGERRAEFTQSMDLPATVLDFFAVDVPNLCEGQSLLPMLRGEIFESRNAVTYGRTGSWESLRTRSHHLVRLNNQADREEPKRLLFLKPDDVWDWHDVSAQEPELTETLTGQLDAFLEAAKSQLPAVPRLAEPVESGESPVDSP